MNLQFIIRIAIAYTLDNSYKGTREYIMILESNKYWTLFEGVGHLLNNVNVIPEIYFVVCDHVPRI